MERITSAASTITTRPRIMGTSCTALLRLEDAGGRRWLWLDGLLLGSSGGRRFPFRLPCPEREVFRLEEEPLREPLRPLGAGRLLRVLPPADRFFRAAPWSSQLGAVRSQSERSKSSYQSRLLRVLYRSE